MARVLLLNPPSRGRPILRDYACGESTKADYYWGPIDLLVLSGLLTTDHDVSVVDATAECLSHEAALARVEATRPDCVFSLTAAVSLDADDAFAGEVKARTGAPVYAFGDVASFAPIPTLAKTRHTDGLLQNFADTSLRRLAEGRRDGVSSAVLRGPGGSPPDVRPVRLEQPMRYATPRHDLFPLHRYRMPFTRWTRSTSVLTAYGCPFPCSFCASRNLPRQLRPVEDVVTELAYLKTLGLGEFYFRDFTFGPSRARAKELCRAIAGARLGLEWSAECRIDVLDEETLGLMREAGCELILVGIETGTEEVGAALRKEIPLAQSQRVLSAARERGIRSCGHFVLGVPGETRAQIEQTIRAAAELPLDFASFNLYAPRVGTPMRDELVARSLLAADDFESQDVSLRANAFAAVDAPTLKNLYRSAMLRFYFRPQQVLRLLRNTPWSALARQGFGLLRLAYEAEH